MGFKKKKITSSVVQRLTAGETIMDTDQPGFGVRRQHGAPIFFVRKYANGRRHFDTIGEYGTGGLTVTVARNKASQLIAAIRDGLSPAQRRAKDRSMPTVAQLADHWFQVHVDAKLKPRTAETYRSTLRSNVLPEIGKLRVDELDEAVIAKMHHKARATPYAANRCLAILSKLMGFAEQQGYRPKNSNPVRGIERYREEKRERFLSGDEVIALGAALSDPAVTGRHSHHAIAAIGFLILTGMRLREALHLQWDEVDLNRSMLFLQDSKTGRKPIVLGAPAVDLIRSIPKMANSPWVFPSPIDPEKPMTDVKRTWRTVSKIAGIEGVRIHDLRHSFASIAAGSGGSLPMIGRLLGHSQSQTTQRYAHLANDPLKELADRASSEIAAALMGSNDINSGPAG